MAWKEVTRMSQRLEFVMLAMAEGANVTWLCARYGVARKTGYKWLQRYKQLGLAGLADLSRRPVQSPNRTGENQELAVLAVRMKHWAWGGRKIAKVLESKQKAGQAKVPAPSTITGILRRHGLIDQAESAKRKTYQRFEHPTPNDLWQMDFKGHFALGNGRRCHPLTVLDDHSRFSIVLRACDNELGTTVRQHLIDAFALYGLPKRMLMDNGSPWGSDAEHPYTPLTVWLIRLGIGVTHGRPFHPQTQGKEERFHRTLKLEVLDGRFFDDVPHTQRRFDPWRDVYNLERPHEALNMAVPATRYQPSPRAYPRTLTPIEYGPGDVVRKVQAKGELSYRGRVYTVGKAFGGHPVGLRPTTTDGVLDVYFCHKCIGRIDVRQAPGRGKKSTAACPTSVRCAHSGRASGGTHTPREN